MASDPCGARQPTAGPWRDLDALRQMEFPITTYEVSREKVLEYVGATGDRNPVHFDVAAARALGYRDIIAPPTFAAVFATAPIRRAVADPTWAARWGLDPAKILHGEQAYEFVRPFSPGDRVFIQCVAQDIEEKKNLLIISIATRIDGEDGQRFADGRATLVVRP